MNLHYLYSAAEFDFSRIPTDSDLVSVATTIGYGWDLLAPFLSIDEGTVEKIKEDYGYSTEKQIFQLLKAWKKKHGGISTFKGLLKSMRECDAVNVDWIMLQKELGFNRGKKSNENLLDIMCT